MELTSMFLNQLTNKTNNNIINTSSKSGDFNEVLTKAENKATSVKNNKDFSNYKNYDAKDNRVDNKQVTKPKDKPVVAKENITSNKNENSVDKVEKQDNSIEDKDKVIVVDEETLNKLSDILGISTDKIMDILSNLSLSVSMLQEPENLIKFLQDAFNANNPIELLSMDNIKDIMKDITDISKSINYTDIIDIDENIGDKINNIIDENNLKNVTLLDSKNEDIKQKISNLLEELNGSVEESTENSNLKNNGLQIKVKADTEINEDLKNPEKLVNVEEVKEVKQNDDKASYYQGNNQNKNNEQNLLLSQKNIQNNKQEIFTVSEVNNTKVFNASLPKTQVLKNINTSDVVAQIMEKIKFSIKPNISEVKMLLKPEQLGEVSLKIATQNGIVTAQFIAENQKVKEIIESNFNQLRDMLSEQGVDIGALEVNVSDSGEQESKYSMFEQNFEKSEKRVNDLIENSFIKEEQEKQIKEEHIIDSQVNYSI